MEDVLRASGLAVFAVASEGEAFDALEGDGGFALLVTDVHLGDGSGWNVARKARSRSATIPALYMSADAESEFEREAVPGAVLLNKPFGMDALSKALAVLGLSAAPLTGEPDAVTANTFLTEVGRMAAA